VSLERNGRVGRGRGGEGLGVGLEELPAGDVFDEPVEELCPAGLESFPLGSESFPLGGVG
jgi:hypothetical protein